MWKFCDSRVSVVIRIAANKLTGQLEWGQVDPGLRTNSVSSFLWKKQGSEYVCLHMVSMIAVLCLFICLSHAAILTLFWL